MSPRITPCPLPCTHTAVLADAAVSDLASVIEQLGELIGAGNDESNALNGMRALLARAAAMVDTVAKAHGGTGWDHSALHWLFDTESRKAMQTLEPIALAAKRARQERAQAEGGAA